MPSVCHNIKQEYEKLQDLKQKFVSVCAEAGDTDALSKSELIRLKKLKRNLEKARDACEGNIEDKSVGMWKNYFDAVNAAVADVDPYKGMNVRELIDRPAFRKSIVDNIRNDIQESQAMVSYSYAAVTGFFSAKELGLLTKNEIEEIQKMMEQEAFQDKLTRTIESDIIRGQEDMQGAWRGATGYYAAIRMGLCTADFKCKIQKLIEREMFRSKLLNDITLQGLQGRTNPGSTERAVTGLQAALGLGLVLIENKARVQNVVGQQWFQSQLVRCILSDSKIAQTSGAVARSVACSILAAKELSELSRRRKKK